jgi:endonuclease/exonuclease/phosphatase family metal-dependent hydrolase
MGRLSRSRGVRLIPALVAAVVCSACASFGLNYLHPQGPRCAAALGDARPGVSAERLGQFTLVSFNIKFGERPEQARQALARAGFDTVDVLLLQEVDLRSARLVAESLDHNYVYYPAAIHPASERQFGLALLSPWPIRDDRKILLPWLETGDDARKIAVAATVWVQGRPVGVVNTHLQSGLTPVKTGDQLQAITGCVYTANCRHAGAPMLDGLPSYVLAGDLNTRTRDSVRVADEVLGWSGLRRVPDIGRTYRYLPFGFDHIYASHDLEVRESGVVKGLGDTGSDHLPIYAVFGLSGPPRDAWAGFDAEAPWAASVTSPTAPTAATLSCDCPPEGCA